MINSVENTDIIDKYLRNELNDIEKQEFERLLSAPSESLYGISLNEEMELQKEIILAIKARGLKECLQKKEEDLKLEKEIVLAIRERGLRESLQREEENIRKSRRKKRTILIWSGSVTSTLIAASLVFMIVLAPIANLMKEESIIYAESISISSTRGSQDNDLQNQIITIYKLVSEKQFNKANKEASILIEKLQNLQQRFPSEEIKELYDQALWLQTICEMNQRHVFEAKRLLKIIANNKENPFSKKAEEILKKL